MHTSTTLSLTPMVIHATQQLLLRYTYWDRTGHGFGTCHPHGETLWCVQVDGVRWPTDPTTGYRADSAHEARWMALRDAGDPMALLYFTRS